MVTYAPSVLAALVCVRGAPRRRWSPPSLKPAGRSGSGAEQAEGTAQDAPDRAAGPPATPRASAERSGAGRRPPSCGVGDMHHRTPAQRPGVRLDVTASRPRPGRHPRTAGYGRTSGPTQVRPKASRTRRRSVLGVERRRPRRPAPDAPAGKPAPDTALCGFGSRPRPTTAARHRSLHTPPPHLPSTFTPPVPWGPVTTRTDRSAPPRAHRMQRPESFPHGARRPTAPATNSPPSPALSSRRRAHDRPRRPRTGRRQSRTRTSRQRPPIRS